MNTEEEKHIVITDKNQNKLAESSTSNESIPSEATTVVSDGSEPQTVSTDMGMSSENSEPVDSQPNSEQTSDSNGSESQPPAGSETQPPAGSETQPPAGSETQPPAGSETEPQPIAIPVNENKPESKTKKHYDQIINKANNVKSQFTKKRRTMSTWDDKEKQEWRVKLSDTLINIIRQSKNKNTLKHHHGKLKSMRNLFNYYLNNLSNSGQPKKTKSKNSKISKK